MQTYTSRGTIWRMRKNINDWALLQFYRDMQKQSIVIQVIWHN